MRHATMIDWASGNFRDHKLPVHKKKPPRRPILYASSPSQWTNLFFSKQKKRWGENVIWICNDSIAVSASLHRISIWNNYHFMCVCVCCSSPMKIKKTLNFHLLILIFRLEISRSLQSPCTVHNSRAAPIIVRYLASFKSMCGHINLQRRSVARWCLRQAHILFVNFEIYIPILVCSDREREPRRQPTTTTTSINIPLFFSSFMQICSSLAWGQPKVTDTRMWIPVIYIHIRLAANLYANIECQCGEKERICCEGNTTWMRAERGNML